MKSPLFYALIALLIFAVRVNAQEAPPACVGDQCTAAAVDAAASAPQTSVVVHSSSVYYPVLGAPARAGAKIVRGTARVLKAALPPYPRVRAKMRANIAARQHARACH
jgi:hypothetical protein